MSRNNDAAQCCQTQGGAQQNDGQQQPHDTMPREEVQDVRAPNGNMGAYLWNNLICVAGRHLASIKGHELHRTFDSKRELLDGCLFFRIDVLRVAVQNGVQDIVVRDRQTGKVWRTTMDTFRACGHLYAHPKFGEQVGLALAQWEECSVDRGDGPKQLSLFGGGGL